MKNISTISASVRNRAAEKRFHEGLRSSRPEPRLDRNPLLESGAEAAAVQTLRVGEPQPESRSVWTAATSAPLRLRGAGAASSEISTATRCARIVSALIFVTVFCLQGSAQTNTNAKPAGPEFIARMGSRGVGVHDPSTIVRCKDEYWVFYTGRGVQSWHSKDLVHWERGPRVFSQPPPWVRETVPANRSGMDFWAPDVIHLGDRYLLFYSVSSFGRNGSAIALATNPTLDPDDPQYHWTDEGVVIQSNAESDFNTIDPAVTLDERGNLWLAFGSFWSGIRMIQLDPKTGKRLAPDSPIYFLAHYSSIEASYLHHHGSYYYLFVNWGMCCRGVNSTYNIRVGRSEKITGPYLDKEGKDLLLGGGSLVLGSQGPFIGPGHAGIIEKDGTNWLSFHFYDGTRNGAPTLGILPLHWSADGWPEVDIPK